MHQKYALNIVIEVLVSGFISLRTINLKSTTMNVGRNVRIRIIGRRFVPNHEELAFKLGETKQAILRRL